MKTKVTDNSDVGFRFGSSGRMPAPSAAVAFARRALIPRRHGILFGVLAGCALLCGAGAAESRTPIDVSRGKARPISPAFVGFNGNMTLIDKPWSEPRLVEALSRSHAGNFRYPGGTVGNYWDWSIGGIKQSLSKEDFGGIVAVADAQQSTGRYTLDNFVSGMKDAGGVTPVFMLNMTFDSLEGQIAQLKKAERLGAPVKYVELGNEFYFDRAAHPRIDDAYPSAEKYAEAVNRWGAAIKQAFPGARVAACATGSEGLPQFIKSERKRTWDERLLKVLEDVDALTVHFYIDPGLGESKPKKEMHAARNDKDQLERERGLLKTPAGVARVLSRPWQAWNSKMGPSILPHDKELWITEFNLRDYTGAVMGTWAHGLAIANFMNLFLEDGRPNVVCYHNFYVTPLFTAVHQAKDAGSNAAGRGKAGAADGGEAPTPYAFNGPGEAMALFGEAMTGMTRATRLVFAPSPVTEAKQDQPAYSTLFGWVLDDPSHAGTGERVLVANLSSETRAVVTASLGGAGPPYRQTFGDPAKTVLNERSLNRKTGRLGRTLELPPYSITVIGPR